MGSVVVLRLIDEANRSSSAPPSSKALNGRRGPAIIVSASGMATGGRVVHHLAHRLPDFNNTVVLVGFQAEGTRGRALADGAGSIKLLGRYVPVRADVVDLPAFSAHADRIELVDWLRTAPRQPCGVFVVHGEERASLAFADSVTAELDGSAVVPRRRRAASTDAP